MSYSQVAVTAKQEKIYVSCPFSPAFNAFARNKGASWLKDIESWAFHESQLEMVEKKLLGIFGSDGRPITDPVEVELRYWPDFYRDQDAIYEFGYEIARARSRDSGARPKFPVLTGGFKSGGSAKNWDTRVLDKGHTTIRIPNVDRRLVEIVQAHCSETDESKIYVYAKIVEAEPAAATPPPAESLAVALRRFLLKLDACDGDEETTRAEKEIMQEILAWK